jgi:hypothetical protein
MKRWPLLLLFAFVVPASAQDQKDDKAKMPESGSITGVVASKGDGWIEVKADDQTRPRRYVARWKDAADAAKIKDASANARVKLDWTMIDSRPRIDKIEPVLATGDSGKKAEPEKKPVPGKNAGEVAPPPRLKM